MGVRVLEDKEGLKCLYCSVVMVAFGPIFYENEEPDDFLEWVKKDVRLFSDKELENAVYEWRREKGCEDCGSKVSVDENGMCESCARALKY